MELLDALALFLVGFGVGGAITAYGTWKACHDNVVRYFRRRGYSPEVAIREADRAVDIEDDEPEG